MSDAECKLIIRSQGKAAMNNNEDGRIDATRDGEAVSEITSVLREMLNELRDISTSLKSIARSQANQTSVQKSLVSKGSAGGDHR
jgi:hypothetical protein